MRGEGTWGRVVFQVPASFERALCVRLPRIDACATFGRAPDLAPSLALAAPQIARGLWCCGRRDPSNQLPYPKERAVDRSLATRHITLNPWEKCHKRRPTWTGRRNATIVLGSLWYDSFIDHEMRVVAGITIARHGRGWFVVSGAPEGVGATDGSPWLRRCRPAA